jgi:histidinol-phosphate/aromatic aminotransferase/cobyric acid decarboxylase-like protein
MHQLSELVPITPPWAVSLPAQVAAVKALEDAAYYSERYRETRGLRDQLVGGLRKIGIEEVVPGAANFTMLHLGAEHSTAADLSSASKKCGVFLRDVSLMGTNVGPRALRIAVKNEEGNKRILETLERLLHRAK